MRHPSSSRQRYRRFVEFYKQRHLDIADVLSGDSAAYDRAGNIRADDRKLEQGRRAKRREYLRGYSRWLWPHRYRLGAVCALALAVTGIQMLEPLFMRFIIDRVLLNGELTSAMRLRRLNLVGAAFLVLILASHSLGLIKDYRQRLLGVRVMLSLRRALYEKLLHLPLTQLTEMKTGGILSRLTGDVETTAGMLQTAIVSPSLAIIRLVIGVSVLTALNWQLAAVAIAVIPGAMYVSFVSSRRIRPIYRTLRHDLEILDGRVGEVFYGIRIVRAFGRESHELLNYMRARHTVQRKELFAHRRELALWAAWGLTNAAISVVIVWYGGYLNVQGRASIGTIMAFQWYTFQLITPVFNIVSSFSELQRSLASMERVFEVVAMENEKPDEKDAIDAPAIVHEIRFEGVEFEYVKGRPVVQDFSVLVSAGSLVALVGRSGAGKSTVTDLVARFHDPSKGRILVNGCDIRRFRLRTYRELLAIVQQQVFLFDGSVRDNIAYGRCDATRDEIEDAARRANADEFISRLPERYDTFIGERGAKLSGGQQQRLAIARALLASPQILILDEATSSLDTESEQLIQASMSDLIAGRTTFVIAHRLSTIRRADMILLVDNGKIIERGNHDELMAVRGAYHSMVIRQMESADENVLT